MNSRILTVLAVVKKRDRMNSPTTPKCDDFLVTPRSLPIESVNDLEALSGGQFLKICDRSTAVAVILI
jgi:hypothetical protein